MPTPRPPHRASQAAEGERRKRVSNGPAATHSPLPPVPELRVRALGSAAENPSGDFVLYWMVSSRRLEHNFALEHALAAARRFGRPLLILEPLRAGYRWASDRLHAFVLAGMAEKRAALESEGIGYFPYVEPEPGAGRGLLAALGKQACLVVTDEYPCFFLPNMLQAAANQVGVRLEAVDSNGLLPLRATDRVFPSAHTFRRFLQKELKPHLGELPRAEPLDGADLPAFGGLAQAIERRFKPASPALLALDAGALGAVPIDHGVRPFEGLPGGTRAARARLERFLEHGLPHYGRRNEPEADVASGLSPYLHFGQIGAHEVFARTVATEGWTPSQLTRPVTGSREGWWGLPAQVEGFLDELITWREVGFNFCSLRRDFDRFESLPAFALETLREHAKDSREQVYALEDFAEARTHDALWNAAQRQLVREGRMHNYLRMLWGKKILEWSRRPEDALATMIELNNRFAVDGRDPNSYSGIFWVLGRYDRPWGPERPIFGKVRYMSSDNTARKLDVKGYLERYGEGSGERSAQGQLF